MIKPLDGPLGRLRPSRPEDGRGDPAGRRQGGPASRPELARVVGQVPAVALADEIEAGHVRALVVTGGNPVAAIPEPDRTRAALASLEVLAVVDVMDNELTAMASHVLPATGQLERADLTLAANLSVRSGVQATHASVPASADRWPVWRMFAELSLRMGGDLVAGADPATLSDELFLRGLLSRSPLDPDAVFDAGPRGLDVTPESGWVHGTMLPEGRWRIAPPVLVERLRLHHDPSGRGLVLTPRREVAWSNSVRYAGAGDEPVVRLHPADAEQVGLAAGDLVDVASAHGSMRASVVVDATVRRGVASVTHGRTTSGPGALTSTTEAVDPLTGMPLASGLPVTISPSTRRVETRGR